MKWNRLNAYAIESGQWTISKSVIDGATMYALWRGKEELAIKYDEEPGVLKDLAGQLEREK